jgi:threonyl-tRNA synthetase
VQARDAIGRTWQMSTIQLDFNLPERFDIEYTANDGTKKRPVMIHRAPFGSLERFVAVLIEHCAGNFPLWLAPEQINILPISEKYIGYAEEIKAILEESGITGSIDNRDEKIGRKIRDSEVKKVPFMLIVGEKEQEENKLSVRKHGEGDLGNFSPEEFISYFQGIISESLRK